MVDVYDVSYKIIIKLFKQMIVLLKTNKNCLKETLTFNVKFYKKKTGTSIKMSQVSEWQLTV